MFSNYQLIILGVIFLCIAYLAFYGSSGTSVKEGFVPNPAVAQECAAKCKAAGYCCNDVTQGANQFLSCAQGCYMADVFDTVGEVLTSSYTQSDALGQCERICGAQKSARGCQFNPRGIDAIGTRINWSSLCGVCSDFDPNNPKCAFSGGGKGDNCAAGCKLASASPPAKPIELGKNSGWDFYKVPISGLATDANILSACAGAGMVTPCYGPESEEGRFDDANCTQTSEMGDYGGPMSSTSQALYGRRPDRAPEFDGVYSYMGGGWGNGAGCGVERPGVSASAPSAGDGAGSWCTTGSGYSNRHAFCAKRGTPLPAPTPPAQFTCADAPSCKAGYSAKSQNTQCGTDCLDKDCGCKCYLTNGQVEGQERCLPLNSNTGAGRWPNTNAAGYNANMNCGTCLPRVSKASCNALSEHCYWGIPSAKPIANSCESIDGTYYNDHTKLWAAGPGMFACGDRLCCDKDPTCSSMAGQCPPNQHVPNQEGFNSMKEGFTKLGKNGGWDFYSVPIANGQNATDTNINSTCQSAGMVTPCMGDQSCPWTDSVCTVTSEMSCSRPMSTTAKAQGLVESDAKFNNVFAYMGQNYHGAGCGGGPGVCTFGTNITGGSAFCASKNAITDVFGWGNFTGDKFVGPVGDFCKRRKTGEVWCGGNGDMRSGAQLCGHPEGYSGPYYGLDAATAAELFPSWTPSLNRDCQSNYLAQNFDTPGVDTIVGTGTPGPGCTGHGCTRCPSGEQGQKVSWARTGPHFGAIVRCTNLESGGGICGGPVCTSGECCVDNLKCETYSDTCKNSGKLLKGSDIICPNGGCDDATCCEARGVCKGMVNCHPGLTSPVLDYDTKTCDTNPCANSDCCAPNPQCTADFQCGPGYTYDTSKTGGTCKNTPCEVSDCCKLNQNCVDFVAKNTCGQGETQKNPLSAEPCKGLECEEYECCNLDPTCAAQKFKCEDTFYKYKKLRPDASSFHCAGQTCTEKDCCIITPTYAEPKVQTFPLESNYT